MPYLRAFSTLGCPEASLDECLDLAARFGLGGVELRSLGSTLDLPAHLAAAHGSPEALAQRLEADRAAGRPAVRIVSLDTSYRLVGALPRDRDELRTFVPWADALGVRWLRAFDGGRLADEAELVQAREEARWWDEERARRGWRVQLMVETHDSLLTAAAIQRFAEALPQFGILWDAHHTWRKGGEDPVATWREIHGRVAHVHVKDSVSVPSGRHPYTYVLPGTGEFPAGPLLAELRAAFAGVVSLEWERLWLPDLPPLELALESARARDWW